jgi:hypothetical protein
LNTESISYRESGSNPNSREYFIPRGTAEQLVEEGFVEFQLPLPKSWDADKAFSAYHTLTSTGKQLIMALSDAARAKGYFEKVIIRTNSVQLRKSTIYGWNQVESTINDIFAKEMSIDGELEFVPTISTTVPALEMAGSTSR